MTSDLGTFLRRSSPSVFAVPGRVARKNSRGTGPARQTKSAQPLVATWEVQEDLPAELRLALTPAALNESQSSSWASLFPDDGLSPHEKRILSLPKADEATRIDAVIEAWKRNVFLGNPLPHGSNSKRANKIR